jgi:hypothetical protein
MTKCPLAEKCPSIPVKAQGINETLSFGLCPKVFLACLAHFENIEADLYNHHAVCVSPYQLLIA